MTVTFHPAKIVLLFVLLFSFSLSSGESDDNLGKTLDDYITKFASNRDFSGVVLVAKGEKILFLKAYGMASFELGVPNRTDTRFLLASVTKTFTSAGVLRLRNQGKLALEDPVSKYLKDFPHGDRITIQNLLAHSSGIPDFHHLKEFDEIRLKRHTLPQLLDFFQGTSLEFEPGEKHQYNNAGYVTLARIIEVVSGQSYEEYLGDQIFEPLGMDNTGLFDRSRLIPNMATGYAVGPPPDLVVPAEYFEPSYAVGSGALFSTAEDLLKWGRSVRNQTLVDFYAERWPWGWGRDSEHDLSWIDQTGLLPGYESCLSIYKDKDVYVIYLGNIQTVSFSQFNKDIRTMVFHLEDNTFTPPDFGDVAPEAFQKDLARFRHPDAGTFRLILKQGNLYMYWEDYDSFRYLRPLSKEELYDRSEGTILQLQHDPKGKVIQILFKSPWGTSECPRIED